MDIQYKGARWFKCDLHLHTPASQCFLDKNVTPEQWVNTCLMAGLNCVAVTDHNTGGWIDRLKTAAEGTGLTIFPGVEITCDTSKIHLLLIFDSCKTTQDVEDFLLSCGIARNMFASSEAHSSFTVSEIANKANAEGALVIPAHIDEFSGLAYEASRASLKEFLELSFIYAVQFVHPEFLDPKLKVKNNQELLEAINSYYGKSTPAIGENDIKNGFDGIQTAIHAQKSLLTFSDNPDSSNPSKHGLSGIGKHYTWVKMDGNPTLEGLRQAFMMPDRTIHSYKSKHAPYKLPSLWIKKLVIQNTTLTENNETFEVEFNPQLTTIIGGRGSGKSSLLRFLRGVFNKVSDLEDHRDVQEDYKQFFKKEDDKGQGVLKDNTLIQVYFIRDGLEYCVTYQQDIRTSKVERLDLETGKYNIVEDEAFIDFFQFEEYSQKQIFSIAQKPNSLRNRIDSAIVELGELRTAYHQDKQEYKSLMEQQRSLQQIVKNKGKINTEIADLKSKIELLKRSGIAEIITKQQSYMLQRQHVKDYLELVKLTIQQLDITYPKLEMFAQFDDSSIADTYRREVSNTIQPLTDGIRAAGTTIKTKSEEIRNQFQNVVNQLKASPFIVDSNSCNEQFNNTKVELEMKGVSDMTDFEKYNSQIRLKEEELKQVSEKEIELTKNKTKIDDLKQMIVTHRAAITERRRNFVQNQINSNKIRISINPYSDKSDFKKKFRTIVQKNTGYDSGIDTLTDNVYADKNIMSNLESVKQQLHTIHDDPSANSPYDGWMTKLIRDLSPSQMDDLDLLYPEDEIEMRYKGREGNFKSLSVASAGQKTTAILSFILSFGDVPLVLDQPEDDLDNRLVYELIVDKIRQIKDIRQVIVVTHNANIPVNGDAEYVVSLSSETHNLKIQAEGTVESDLVKNEICEVMEGGVEAFRTRAKRYASLNMQ